MSETAQNSTAGDAPEHTNSGERKFPCPGCGAEFEFDPATRSLRCPFCDFAQPIAPATERVSETGWADYWQNAGRQQARILGRSCEVTCGVCAAIVLIEDKVVTSHCPYCGSQIENQPRAAQSMIAPDGLLPFVISQDQALKSFRVWIERLWFAPSDLRKSAAIGRLWGSYMPFWTYDSDTYTEYTGQRGDNYWETETYTENDAQGNPVTKTRQVMKTRWSYAAGNVQHFFDDVLVCASQSLPTKLVNQLEPWDLDKVEPFRPEFLCGFNTERYTIDLKAGFETAKQVMDGTIRGLCCQDIGGDQQTLSTVQTKHSQITFKHILQPVWIAPYRFRDKTYRVLVNARTGEVVGTRPWSFKRLILIIVAVLAIIGLIALIVAGVGAIARAGGMHGSLPRAAVRRITVARIDMDQNTLSPCCGFAAAESRPEKVESRRIRILQAA
jgi:DNA-directed RNA polymerase subunit RPC12/RpoP